MDTLGDHRSACPTVGKLARRAMPLERTWARVCREAGATVLQNYLLRELNLEEHLRADDGRRLEVVADGLPFWSGAQVALDATLVSPVRRDGTAYPRTAAENGVRLEAARRRKELKYPELLDQRRSKLVVAALEIGGQWFEEAWTFFTLLAQAKARSAPGVMRRSTTYTLLRRWSTMLAVAAQSAYASSLLGESSAQMGPHDDLLPEWGDLLQDREVPTEGPSRLV